MMAAGAIALAAGVSLLAITFAPMFVPSPSTAPVAAAVAGSLGVSGDSSTVVAPTPGNQVTSPTIHVAVTRPVDGVSFDMQIPAIGYHAMVHQGVSLYVLAGGPGHYPGTPWPGQPGNVGVAGHNTFWLSFNRLKAGDKVIIQTEHQLLTYVVTGSSIVDPADRTVLAPTQDRRLTLTTCWPLWAGALATHRLIFTAVQAG